MAKFAKGHPPYGNALPGHNGRVVSEETRRKISIALKDKKRKDGYKTNWIPTPEYRKKLSDSAKRNWQNEEFRKKMKERNVGWNLKKQWTNEEKIEFSRKRKGSGNPNWKGGIGKNKAFYVKRHRIRKMGNGGSHTQGEWATLKAQYNFTCPSCGRKEPEIKLTEDHIIPVSRGGSDNIENIQPLCLSCNARKQTKIIKYTKPMPHEGTSVSNAEYHTSK